MSSLRWWGEKGFIRVQRHSSDKGEEGYCGTDYDPKQGHSCGCRMSRMNLPAILIYKVCGLVPLTEASILVRLTVT